MSRRIPVLAVVLLLLAPAAGQGKGVLSASVCGPEDCVPARAASAVSLLAQGGPLSGPPAKAEPFWTIRVGIGGQGVRDDSTMSYLPAADRLRDDDGTWMEAPYGYREAVARLVGDRMQPFPAEQLPGREAPPAPSVPSSGLAQGGDVALTVVLGLLLAGFAGLVATRRHRGPGAPAAT